MLTTSRPFSRRVSRIVTIALAATTVAAVGATAAPASAAPTQQQQIADYIEGGSQPGARSTDAVPTRTAVLEPGTQSTWSETSGSGPAQSRFIPAFGYSLLHPNATPPGANNYNCKPRAGQRPVVLIHGTWENAYDNFAMISPELTKAGFCTYAFNFGRANITNGGGLLSLMPGTNGTGDIATSAGHLSEFVNKVLERTGASAVDLVGHSQGGLMARQYLKFNGGQSKVKKLVTMGATNHGTTVLGIGTLGRLITNLGIDVLSAARLPLGVAGTQQIIGSDFLAKLNRDGDTVPGIDYTVIRTKFDEVTTPSASTFLKAGPNARVDNVTMQDGCPIDLSDHLSMSYSPRMVSLIKRAIDPSTPLVCAPNGFITG